MTTVEVAPQGPKPLIRLRPAPRYEPPFDDERDYEPFPSAHQLALVWPAPAWPTTATADTGAAGQDDQAATKDAVALGGPHGETGRDPTAGTTVAAGPLTAAGTTAIAGATTSPSTTSGADTTSSAPTTADTTGSPGTTTRAGSMIGASAATSPGTTTGADTTAGADVMGAAGGAGDARLAVRRFVNACVEVLNGYRPAAHLRRLALPAEAARVVAQAIAGAHRVAELRRRDLRRPAPRARRRAAPVAVLCVRACEPRHGLRSTLNDRFNTGCTASQSLSKNSRCDTRPGF